MRLVCQEGLLPGADRREKYHNGREYGFDGIEIGGRGLKANLTEYKELSHEFGLPVTSICLGWEGCLLDADPRERDKAVAGRGVSIEDCIVYKTHPAPARPG